MANFCASIKGSAMSEPKYLTMPELYPGSTRPATMPPPSQDITPEIMEPYTPSLEFLTARVRSERRSRD